MNKVLHRAKAITGWMSDAELSLLAEIASRSNNILEVGAYKGRTTRALADNTKGRVLSVDPWDGAHQVHKGIVHFNGDSSTFGEFYCYLNDHINSGKVRFKRDFFRNLTFGEPFDFIFIDALHDYESVRDDIMHAVKFMGTGILAGHDYGTGWDGVEKAVREIFGTDYDVEETIWYVEYK